MCCLSACTSGNGNNDANDTSSATELYVSFTVDNALQARSVLESSANIQQVTTVYLYIFRGNDDHAVYVACEDVGWKQPTGSTAMQRYQVMTPLDKGEEYVLLGVGVDGDARTTYGFPNVISEGCKLGEAKAKLSAGKTWKDMEKAPLFAGSETIIAGDTENYGQVTIVMNRRVAGILCYLKNIPYLMQRDGTDVQVDKVRLLLHDKQNTSMLLPKPLTGTDTGSAPSPDDASRILAEFSMKDAGGNYYPQSTEGNYYEIPAVSGAELTTVDNSVFKGLFILPIENATSGATLTLQALDADGNEIYVWTLRDATAGSKFALQPNHLYSIGIKSSADNTGHDDDPLDLQYNSFIVLVPDFEAIYELGDGGMKEE